MKIKLKQIVVAVVTMVATSLFAEFDWEAAAGDGLIKMVNLKPSAPSNRSGRPDTADVQHD